MTPIDTHNPYIYCVLIAGLFLMIHARQASRTRRARMGNGLSTGVITFMWLAYVFSGVGCLMAAYWDLITYVPYIVASW